MIQASTGLSNLGHKRGEGLGGSTLPVGCGASPARAANYWTGQTMIAASAWSCPGTYSLKLDAKPGQRYAVEVSQRDDSLLPGTLLGPIGGMIDSANNENAGAFQLKLAGAI